MLKFQKILLELVQKMMKTKFFLPTNETLVKLTFLGSNIRFIGQYSFRFCGKLQNIDLSQQTSLESIGNGAFRDCYELSSVSFPAISNKVSLGDNIFRNTNLHQNVDLTPFKYISGDAFLLTKCSFTCQTVNQYFTEFEGNIYSHDKVILVLVSYSCQKIIYPPETRELGLCCYSNSCLKVITIPDQITKHNLYVFHNTLNLETAFVSRNMKEIGLCFCSENKKLKNIYFQEGTTTFKKGCIFSSDSLEIVHFPTTVTTVEADAFNLPKLYAATASSEEQKNMLIAGGIPKRAFLRHCQTCKHTRFSLYSLSVFATILFIFQE